MTQPYSIDELKAIILVDTPPAAAGSENSSNNTRMVSLDLDRITSAEQINAFEQLLKTANEQGLQQANQVASSKCKLTAIRLYQGSTEKVSDEILSSLLTVIDKAEFITALRVEMNVHHTHLGEFAALSSFIEKNKTLRSLTLEISNHIANAKRIFPSALAEETFVNALNHNCTLQNVNLHGKYIRQGGKSYNLLSFDRESEWWNRKNAERVRFYQTRNQSLTQETEAYKLASKHIAEPFFQKMRENEDEKEIVGICSAYFKVLAPALHKAHKLHNDLKKDSSGQYLVDIPHGLSMVKAYFRELPVELTDTALCITFHDECINSLYEKNYHRILLLLNCIEKLTLASHAYTRWVGSVFAPLNNIFIGTVVHPDYKINIACLKLMAKAIIEQAIKKQEIALLEQVIKALIFPHEVLLTEADRVHFNAEYEKAVLAKLEILNKQNAVTIDLSNMVITVSIINKLIDSIKIRKVAGTVPIQKIILASAVLTLPADVAWAEALRLESNANLFADIELDLSKLEQRAGASELSLLLAQNPPKKLTMTDMASALVITQGVVQHQKEMDGIYLLPTRTDKVTNQKLSEIMVVLQKAKIHEVAIKFANATYVQEGENVVNDETTDAAILAILDRDIVKLIQANNPSLHTLTVKVSYMQRSSSYFNCRLDDFLNHAAPALQANPYITCIDADKKELENVFAWVKDDSPYAFIPRMNIIIATKPCLSWVNRNQKKMLVRQLLAKSSHDAASLNQLGDALEELEDGYQYIERAEHRGYLLAKARYYLECKQSGATDVNANELASNQLNHAIAALINAASNFTNQAAEAEIGLEKIVPLFFAIVEKCNSNQLLALSKIKEIIVTYFAKMTASGTLNVNGSLLSHQELLIICNTPGKNAYKVFGIGTNPGNKLANTANSLWGSELGINDETTSLRNIRGILSRIQSGTMSTNNTGQGMNALIAEIEGHLEESRLAAATETLIKAVKQNNSAVIGFNYIMPLFIELIARLDSKSKSYKDLCGLRDTFKSYMQETFNQTNQDKKFKKYKQEEITYRELVAESLNTATPLGRFVAKRRNEGVDAVWSFLSSSDNETKWVTYLKELQQSWSVRHNEGIELQQSRGVGGRVVHAAIASEPDKSEHESNDVAKNKTDLDLRYGRVL